MLRILTLLSTCAVLLVGVSCSGEAEVAGSSSTPSPAQISLPSQLLGLQVKPEPIKGNLDSVSRSYLDSLGLFGFRTSSDLLRATLQVGRFSDIAEHDKRTFRNSIVSQLGSSVPREVRLSGTPVYLTTGNDQNIFMWFADRGFFVLSVRDDYEFPRTLLRRLIEMDIVR